MTTEAKQISIERFEKLEAGKRNRILNAAMQEFRYGYKKATTDIIVKEAGISKGLLFHYFGSKERLYTYVVKFSAELIQKEFFDLINLGSGDILEGFWQFALLKRDLTTRYPYLYEFIDSMYIHRGDVPSGEVSVFLEKDLKAMNEELLNHFDAEFFRDDIDYKNAITIINLTMDGIISEAEAGAMDVGGWNDESYEEFLETLREYIDIFRTCFYKEL